MNHDKPLVYIESSGELFIRAKGLIGENIYCKLETVLR
jgi:hypothetical protein